jgi:hypothetical protein
MPNTEAIERIESLQATVTEGDAAQIERNEIAFDLWQKGMTQREIADMLDRVDRQHGGTGVTHAKTQKMLRRMRSGREDNLMMAAT